ncbi:HAD family hydrolase [Streptacidiphilus sp. PAMC 29251]
MSPQRAPAAAKVERAKVVLLDFDGPVCSVFAGHPAPGVARKLLRELDAQGVRLPGELAGTEDPHGLLDGLAKALGGQGLSEPEIKALTRQLDGRLAEAEQEAVGTAAETPDAVDAVLRLLRSGRSVAVVSNNATAAVEAYLRRREPLAELLRGRVFGRPADPALMKPRPYLLDRAVAAVRGSAADAVLIGDAVTDVEAAAGAGVDFVGFAGGDERRRKRLVGAGVADDCVIDHWSELGAFSLLQ